MGFRVRAHPFRWCALALSLAILVAVGASLKSGSAPPAWASGSAKEARGPARLLVTAEEWRLRLSRPKLRKGRAIIQLFNRGEDVHDLRLRRVGRTRKVGTEDTAPGGTAKIRTKLRRGRYVLWCSIPGHRALGMEAVLKVRKRK